jgi:hypothetical protein
MRAINTIRDYDQREFYLGYEKYLREVFREPTESEIKKMEEDFFKPSTVSNRIISLKPANNQYYQPQQGA